MASRLSKKERGFVKDVVNGETGVQAALNNYDTTDYSTAASIASENLTKPKIVKAIEDSLPDDLLEQVHREGLFATKGIYGEQGDRVAEDADFNVRAKYLDMAYKRRGLYAPEKSVTLNVDVDLTDTEQRLARELLQQQRATPRD